MAGLHHQTVTVQRTIPVTLYRRPLRSVRIILNIYFFQPCDVGVLPQSDEISAGTFLHRKRKVDPITAELGGACGRR